MIVKFNESYKVKPPCRRELWLEAYAAGWRDTLAEYYEQVHFF